MRRSRCTEERIVAILAEPESGLMTAQGTSFASVPTQRFSARSFPCKRSGHFLVKGYVSAFVWRTA